MRRGTCAGCRWPPRGRATSHFAGLLRSDELGEIDAGVECFGFEVIDEVVGCSIPDRPWREGAATKTVERSIEATVPYIQCGEDIGKRGAECVVRMQISENAQHRLRRARL